MEMMDDTVTQVFLEWFVGLLTIVDPFGYFCVSRDDLLFGSVQSFAQRQLNRVGK
jgi:hypothetical protein